MRRREFMAMLGGAAARWPLAARAQERTRRIGVLVGAQRPDDPESQANFAAFLQGLHQLGWDESRNVQINYRWGLGNADNVRKYAMELAAIAPDVILASGTSTMTPLSQATRTLPIIFVNVADPVGAGFVDSLSRPGGNTTGFLQFEYGLSAKWLELLKESAPSVTRAAVLRDPSITAGIGQFAIIQSLASSVGVEVSPVTSTPAARAMLQQTRTIPIMIVLVADPVGSGYVATDGQRRAPRADTVAVQEHDDFPHGLLFDPGGAPAKVHRRTIYFGVVAALPKSPLSGLADMV